MYWDIPYYNDDLIGTYCDAVAPLSVATNSSVLYVLFHSPATRNGTGFMATYSVDSGMVTDISLAMLKGVFRGNANEECPQLAFFIDL